ncbi:MAG: transposase [Opitutales bacterium]|nr:transposase [Opitutales bacterium]
MAAGFRVWRRRLPHWEVRGGRYFITIRCAGSLPIALQRRLESLCLPIENKATEERAIETQQRSYFRLLEKYLDEGSGFAPFATPSVARSGLQSMRRAFEKEGWAVGPIVMMPNHSHVIVRQLSDGDLECVMKRVKGRVARETNALLGRSGKFWQREWFDRLIRDDAEYARTARYIRNNPVKAHLAAEGVAYAGYDAGSPDPRLVIR